MKLPAIQTLYDSSGFSETWLLFEPWLAFGEGSNFCISVARTASSPDEPPTSLSSCGYFGNIEILKKKWILPYIIGYMKYIGVYRCI